MISVEGLTVEFNATPLFEDVSYVINKKDRIALVGKNGAGKSTMLKILAGLQGPTPVSYTHLAAQRPYYVGKTSVFLYGKGGEVPNSTLEYRGLGRIRKSRYRYQPETDMPGIQQSIRLILHIVRTKVEIPAIRCV